MVYNMEIQHKPSSQKWGDLLIIGTIYMCQIASPIYSIATVIPAAFDPCATPWVGSLWLRYEFDQSTKTMNNICNWPKNSVSWDAIQIILVVIQSYFAVYIMFVSVLSACHFMIVLLISMARLLKQLLENVTKQETAFWDSKMMDRYRGLYVLEKCLNDAYQDGFIAFSLAALVTCIILTFYISLRVSKYWQ